MRYWSGSLEGHDFYELYGFLSRAGNHKAVLPLIFLVMEGDEQDQERCDVGVNEHRLSHGSYCAD